MSESFQPSCPKFEDANELRRYRMGGIVSIKHFTSIFPEQILLAPTNEKKKNKEKPKKDQGKKKKNKNRAKTITRRS
jgi:hypothetical protein